MKFLFLGAGAIGSYVGGSLALAGFPVAFVEQPAPAAALRRDGLRLTIGGVTRAVPSPEVYDSAPEAVDRAGADLAVCTLKSFDTEAVVEALKSRAGRLPPVLCLQNGVENERTLSAAFCAADVIAGTVTSAVGRGAAGEITLERLRGIGIFHGHPLSREILRIFRAAGLRPRPYTDSLSMKWSKLLTNLLANASSAILDRTPAEIFADPPLFDLERAMLRECLAVMRKLSIPVTDLPGTPVGLLAFAIERLPRLLAQPALLRAVGGGRGGKMPSFYIDLHSGRGKSEVRWLNGAVARFGAEVGIPAPVNQALTEILEGLVDGRLRMEDFHRKPEELLRLVNIIRSQSSENR